MSGDNCLVCTIALLSGAFNSRHFKDHPFGVPVGIRSRHRQLTHDRMDRRHTMWNLEAKSFNNTYRSKGCLGVVSEIVFSMSLARATLHIIVHRIDYESRYIVHHTMMQKVDCPNLSRYTLSDNLQRSDEGSSVTDTR